MKEIKLKNGFVALVDDEDYDSLIKVKWYAHKNNAKTYIARRTVWINGLSHEISMHREIMKAPKGMEVDHINHDGLDNRKCNLRICTQSENARNRSAYGKCKYLGVTQKSNYKKYISRIYSKGNAIRLGVFNTAWAAAIAYDLAAKKYHGEFANLNFK